MRPKLPVTGLIALIGDPVRMLGIPTSPADLVKVVDALIQCSVLHGFAWGKIINTGCLDQWGCQSRGPIALTAGHFNLLIKRQIRWYGFDTIDQSTMLHAVL